MFNLHLFVVVFLFAVATQISGGDAVPETVVRTDIKGRLLTPAEGCGFSKVPNTRIVGGSPAKKGAWPWIALLGHKDKMHIDFSCGGSLITSKHVLSAAHCFLKDPINFVRLGEHDTDASADQSRVDISIDHVESHKNYDDATKINDIAIVYLAHDVKFTDRIGPICLPTSKELQSRDWTGMNPFVAGFGRLKLKQQNKMTNILHQLQIPVLENNDCRTRYREAERYMLGLEYRFNKKYILCAGITAGGKDVCFGDSGNPLMVPIHENGRFPFYQIGVVSYGFGCGRPNMPGIYTNVGQYIDWINKKLH